MIDRSWSGRLLVLFVALLVALVALEVLGFARASFDVDVLGDCVERVEGSPEPVACE